MNSEKSEILPNIVTEHGNGEGLSPDAKARNRMVAEGYRYQALRDSDASNLDPVPNRHTEDKQSRLQNKYLMLLILAVVMITCLTAVLIWQHFSHKIEMQEIKVCTNQSCVRGSAYIMNKMDLKTDPCKDFYTYSCGGWLKNTPIPPSKSKFGSFGQIQDEIYDTMKEVFEKGGSSEYMGVHSAAIQKSRDLYNLCMDTEAIEADGTEQILKFIKTQGSWPVTSDPLSGPWIEASWDMQEAMLKSAKINSHPFFSLAVYPDDRNSSESIIVLHQSGLTLDEPREYFSNHSNYEPLRKAFLNYTVQFGKLLGAENSVEQKMEKLYEFEQSLAEVWVPADQLLDPVKNYHKMTLTEFQDKYLGKWLNITKFVSDLFEKEIVPATQILVETPQYFIDLQPVITKTGKEVLATYIMWQNLSPRTGYMPDDFVNAIMVLEKTEHGVTKLDPRWKRCLKKVESVLGFASGALYIQENFAESSKNEVESLFESIRQSFIDNLPSVAWMDTETRDYAKEKANAVINFLGYPDFIKDPLKLDKYYENLTLVDGEFFSTSVSIGKFFSQKSRKDFGKPPDKKEWGMSPTEVNGYYNSAYNHIVFPAGILRPPTFNPTFPRSFNFGSFGMIVGHELTHGFDNRGRNYDKDGNMRNWWSNSSQRAFEEHTQCYVDQYSKFTYNDTHLDGKLTLGENIADNGGLKIAYLAYQKWMRENGEDSLVFPGLKFTSDQLFFIGFAQLWCSHYKPEYAKTAILTDVHSISKFRVIGSMQNSEFFSEVFSCPQNSPLNPETKCDLW